MNKAIAELLIESEKRLQDKETRASRENLDVLLDDAFIEIGASGKIYDKAQILDLLPGEAPPKVSSADFKVMELSPNVIQLTYKAVTTGENSDVVNYSLRSSIWKQAGTSWKILFHQGTPCAPFNKLD